MFRAFKWLIGVALACAPLASVFSQTFAQYDSGYSYREVNPGVDGSPNPANPRPFTNMYHYHHMTGWDDSHVWEGCYRGSTGNTIANGGTETEFMNWRIMLPPGYSKKRAQKYPLLIMLHGAGEGGRQWTGSFNYLPTDVQFDNNGLCIVWGGQPELDAVNRTLPDPRAFPGIVIHPQASYNAAWESGWANGVQNNNSLMATKIIQYMISNQNADPDHVYVHGLSNGAAGAWDLAAKRPDLFTAILPMSGTPSDLNAQTDSLLTTPIWLFQGGQDTNPNPQASTTVVNTMATKGGNLRYYLYPSLGHDTWETAYAEPDFFSWMLSKNMSDIYVFGGDPSLCAGGTLKLGFTGNMISYQWYKNGIAIPGAKSRYYNVTQIGTYTVKFVRRIDGVTYTSNPTTIGTRTSSIFSPTITNTGSVIEKIQDISGADNHIIATAPLGYSQYNWFKNGTAITGASTTSNTYTINTGGLGASTDAGNYTVTVLQANGCISLPSNPIAVIYNATQPTSPRPSTPTMLGTGYNSVKVTWTEYNSESYYELWRFRFGGSSPVYGIQGWTLVTTLPAGTTSYTDQTLRPNAQYRYIIRAILSNGTGIASNEPIVQATTSADTAPPTAPTNLLATNVTDTKATLTWSGSTDNDLVYKYEIYSGSTLLTTVLGGTEALVAPATTINLTGLVTGTTYLFSVRAADYTGNYSPFTDAISVSTTAPANGLAFKYYTYPGNIPGSDGAYLPEPPVNGSFDWTQTPLQTGVVANFDISSAYTFQGVPIDPNGNGDPPNNFVFSFDGYINIPATGHYQFTTGSDDGSRLYINGALLINNDHLQGTTQRSNNTPNTNDIALSAGKIPIRVTYFEQGGGNILNVYWQKTDAPGAFGQTPIPSTSLFLTGATITNYYLTTSATDPSLLASWTTNPTGGTGTAPANFTADLQYFTLANQAAISLSNAWTVSGSGSKVIVGNGTSGITLNISAAYTGAMDVSKNSIVNISTVSLPAFGTMDATSTVNFNVPGNVGIGIPSATYGSVNFQSVNPYTFPSNTTIILGNLSVADGATTLGTPTNVSSVKIGGDLTFSNSSGNPLPTGPTQMFALSFVGGKTHTVTFNTAIDPAFFSLQTDIGDNIVFNNAGTHTYTFGSAIGGGISLKSGSTLNMGANNLVVTNRGTVNSNFETGSIAMSGGNFTLSTTSTQNSSVSFASGNFVNNFSVSAPTTTSISVSSQTNVKNLVTLSSGQLNAGSAYLTLVSDSLSGVTARIATIPAGAKISGTITAQRYMNSKGAAVYRYISSPVKGATAAMLQQSFPITGNFTGKNTIPNVVTSAASMYYYTPGQTYASFPADGGTNADTMRTGVGYTAYIRKANYGTLWSVQGTPNQGTVTFTSNLATGTGSSADGWSLVGNPYASPIVWSGNVSSGWPTFSGINPTVYVRDNTTGGNYTWQVYRPGITVGSLTAGQSILPGGVIAPGQSFWIQAFSTPALAISESAKQTTDVTFYRTDGTSNQTSFDVMAITLSNGTTHDVAYIAHDDAATENYEKSLDAVKQFNTTFNLSTLSKDNVDLAINFTSATFCEKVIDLNLTNAVAGAYTFTFDGLNAFMKPVNAILTDKYLNTTVSLSSGTVYNFAVTADPASSGAQRFVITEKPAVTTSLAVTGSSVCEANPVVTITSPQIGVSYQAMFNGGIVSDPIVATGTPVILQLNRKDLGAGSHAITIVGGFSSCDQYSLTQPVTVTIDTLQTPAIAVTGGYLMANPKDADSYQWLFEGNVVNGQTKDFFPQTQAGTYQVIVTLGSCIKSSQIYSVTGLNDVQATTATAYPNPFTDKITVTLPAPVVDGNAILLNIMGQQVQTSSITSPDSQKVEIKVSNIEAGAYILKVGGYNMKVMKVN